MGRTRKHFFCLLSPILIHSPSSSSTHRRNKNQRGRTGTTAGAHERREAASAREVEELRDRACPSAALELVHVHIGGARARPCPRRLFPPSQAREADDRAELGVHGDRRRARAMAATSTGDSDRKTKARRGSHATARRGRVLPPRPPHAKLCVTASSRGDRHAGAHRDRHGDRWRRPRLPRRELLVAVPRQLLARCSSAMVLQPRLLRMTWWARSSFGIRAGLATAELSAVATFSLLSPPRR
uniref:Uncharacterized protein n=1 Tax=Arundo donax TaxID=35708 RepID=A0A0A8XQD3_ARUDO